MQELVLKPAQSTYIKEFCDRDSHKNDKVNLYFVFTQLASCTSVLFLKAVIVLLLPEGRFSGPLTPIRPFFYKM